MKTTPTRNMVSVSMMVMLVAVLSLIPAFLQAATWNSAEAGAYSWDVNTNPPWDTATFPNGIDAVANLINNIAGNQTINLNQGITVGSLTVGDSDNTHAFTIVGNGGLLTFNNSSGTATLTESGSVASSPNGGDTISANITLASDLAVSNAVNRTETDRLLTLSGDITETAGSRKITYATVSWEGFVISGSNDYSGGTELALGNNSATLEIRNVGALGSGPVTTTSGKSGRINFNLSAPATFANDMQLLPSNGYALMNSSANAVTLNGALSGGATYFKLYGPNGNGGFILGGANTSTSRLFADNTSVTISSSAAVNSFSKVVLTENNGRTGKLYLADGVALTKNVVYNDLFNITSSTAVYLGMSEAGTASISGIVDLNFKNDVGSTAVSDFYLDTPDGATLTLSGVVKNSNTYATNNLVKIGDGTVALTDANTYGGQTTVSNGTLWVNNTSGSGTGSGSVSVATNGALGGTGSITGAVSVAGGGTLAPGTIGVGTLTVGALTLGAEATYAVQLGGTNTTSYDRCVVSTGAVSVAGSVLAVSLTGGYLPVVNDSFTIIRNNPGNPVTGLFSNSPWIRAPGVEGTFDVSYTGGAGHDVVLRYLGVRGTYISIR